MDELKLEMRLAGIFATATFLIIGVANAYLKTLNPMHSLLYGLASSAVMGYIGYQIGYIVAHPAGPGPAKQRSEKENILLEKAAPDEKIIPLTGEETFLDDLEL